MDDEVVSITEAEYREMVEHFGYFPDLFTKHTTSNDEIWYDELSAEFAAVKMDGRQCFAREHWYSFFVSHDKENL